MKKGGVLLVACVLTFVRSVLGIHTDLEKVWLKDMTSSLQKDERSLSDLDLPDDLTFHLSHGSHALKLNLKRNHGIDPNAEVFIVRKLKDGQSRLEKAQHLETEDLAYYQDKENGAFMTVRCVRRSNGQCDRIVNGNVRIGDRNYDLRPAESDVTSRNLVDVPYLLGKQYVLRNQATIQRDGLVKNKDAASVNERNLEEKFKNLLRRFPQEQNKRNHFPHNNSTFSSRKRTELHYRDKKDNVKQVYWVEIAVLIDSTIWDLFLSLVQHNYADEEDVRVLQYIREIYSHVINGVNLLYNGIEDNGIKISVTLAEFFIFKTMFDFPHKKSMVKKKDGINYMNAFRYLDDVGLWDSEFGSHHAKYDHAMLFTRYDLYEDYIGNNENTGMSLMSTVCDIGKRVSVIQVEDFFWSIDTAAHELGHNLGAVHDGEGVAQACPAEDYFIMTSYERTFQPEEPYSRNPWLFSNCSVESFKAILSQKACLLKEGAFFNKNEWMAYVQKEPGERYTNDKQCELSNGPESRFCGAVNADICLFMKCTDPNTGQCLLRHITAARGTRCGNQRWCIEGKCVSKV